MRFKVGDRVMASVWTDHNLDGKPFSKDVIATVTETNDYEVLIRLDRRCGAVIGGTYDITGRGLRPLNALEQMADA